MSPQDETLETLKTNLDNSRRELTDLKARQLDAEELVLAIKRKIEARKLEFKLEANTSSWQHEHGRDLDRELMAELLGEDD